MSLANGTAVAIVALFLVPGFVMTSVRGRLVPRTTFSSKDKLLQFFTFSCVNNAFWAALLLNRPLLNDLVATVPRATVLFLAVAFVSPTILAVLSSIIQQQDLIGRWAPRLGLRVVNPAPSAWDWHLSRQIGGRIEVKLKSGESVFGWFAENSIAGDELRDLFIEVECEPVTFTGDSEPVWKPLGRSIWIPDSEIHYVRFLGDSK